MEWGLEPTVEFGKQFNRPEKCLILGNLDSRAANLTMVASQSGTCPALNLHVSHLGTKIISRYGDPQGLFTGLVWLCRPTGSHISHRNRRIVHVPSLGCFTRQNCQWLCSNRSSHTVFRCQVSFLAPAVFASRLMVLRQVEGETRLLVMTCSQKHFLSIEIKHTAVSSPSTRCTFILTTTPVGLAPRQKCRTQCA